MVRVYQPNSPAVASEIIDGEAVIMHLKSGKYFSAAASGGFIWGCVERLQPVDHIITVFTEQYAATPAQAKDAVESFLAQLLADDLVRPAGDDHAVAPLPLAELGGSNSRRAFISPTLNVYSDMQDLLLLDPIHDVDEVGWPTPAASAKS
jgi:hypothetical protein